MPWEEAVPKLGDEPATDDPADPAEDEWEDWPDIAFSPPTPIPEPFEATGAHRTCWSCGAVVSDSFADRENTFDAARS